MLIDNDYQYRLMEVGDPMTPQSAEIRKKQLIHLLIQNGIYKKSTRHLYELSLTELESEYKHIRRAPEHAET